MNNPVKFLPWIGTQYHVGFNGVRTLVLGESHYQWKCDRDINEWREVTNDLIQEQLDGTYTKAFWTHIAITFLGHKPSLTEKNSFWSSLAFYNYIQESAGDAPRIAPSENSWPSSVDAFYEVLNSLKPQFVLALGDRLCNRLPNLNRSSGKAIPDAPRQATWIYNLRDGQTCLVYGIKHPSSGFNGRTWRPFVLNAMESAK